MRKCCRKGGLPMQPARDEARDLRKAKLGRLTQLMTMSHSNDFRTYRAHTGIRVRPHACQHNSKVYSTRMQPIKSKSLKERLSLDTGAASERLHARGPLARAPQLLILGVSASLSVSPTQKPATGKRARSCDKRHSGRIPDRSEQRRVVRAVERVEHCGERTGEQPRGRARETWP